VVFCGQITYTNSSGTETNVSNSAGCGYNGIVLSGRSKIVKNVYIANFHNGIVIQDAVHFFDKIWTYNCAMAGIAHRKFYTTSDNHYGEVFLQGYAADDPGQAASAVSRDNIQYITGLCGLWGLSIKSNYTDITSDQHIHGIVDSGGFGIGINNLTVDKPLKEAIISLYGVDSSGTVSPVVHIGTFGPHTVGQAQTTPSPITYPSGTRAIIGLTGTAGRKIVIDTLAPQRFDQASNSADDFTFVSNITQGGTPNTNEVIINAMPSRMGVTGLSPEGLSPGILSTGIRPFKLGANTEDAADAISTRAAQDWIYLDGVTSSRVYWPLGTVGAIAPSDFTAIVPIESLAYKVSGDTGIMLLTDDTGFSYGAGGANNLHVLITSTGTLRLAIGTDGNRRYYLATSDRFAADNVGKSGAFVLRRAAGVMSLWWRGAKISLGSELTTGTPPAWTASLGSTYFVAGSAYASGGYKGRIGAPILINSALSDAEIINHATRMVLPDWAAYGSGSMVNQTSGVLTVGYKYRITVAGGTFTGVGSVDNSVGTEFVAIGTAPTWSTGAVIPLGPIFRAIIQPILVVADGGPNKIAGILLGARPITSSRNWVIQGSTSTNGNERLFGTIALFLDATKVAFDTIEVNGTGTPTVGVGSSSGAADYVAAAAVASGRVRRTLVTPFPANVAIWVSSTDTSVRQHTIQGHMVD
jgi:hypothetical protein